MKGKPKLLFALLATLIVVFTVYPSNSFKPCHAMSMDLTVPVGIYTVSVSKPQIIEQGEPVNITVTVNLTGLNPNSPWYNLTMVEGVESVTASIVEAGVRLEAHPQQIMLTNTNATLIKPSPNYVINKTIITVSLTCNSSTLKIGTYSIHVLVKGFRYAISGLSLGYFNFYLEANGKMTMTLKVVGENILQNQYIWLTAIPLSTLTLTIASKKIKHKTR